MWKDSETPLDYLNFDYLVSAVKNIAMDSALTPSTIGVYGDWGSGKSSLMKMVQEDISRENDTICIWFNGWLFEGYEDAKTAFCGTILDELHKNKTIPSKAKTRITNLLKKVDGKKILLKGGSLALDLMLSGGVGALTSLTVEAVLSSLKDKVGNVDSKDVEQLLKDIQSNNKIENKRNDIKTFNEEFKKILDESSIKHLVIFVDELDRCTPDTVLDIFAAMRLFLFVKNTSFVIGADSRLIDYAIKSRYKNIPGNDLDISKEYLEKVIQYPITLPKLDELEIERYLTCLLLESKIKNIAEGVNSTGFFEPIDERLLISANIGKETEIREALGLSKQISPILAAKLNGNPRQCKRFLNTLFMRLQMAESRGVTLNKNVLAKLMLLEYFKPAMYEEVINPSNKDCLAVLEAQSTNSEIKGTSNVFEKWMSEEWVKEWLAIDVKLHEIDLKPYYYFSRSTQRVNQALKQLLSPNAAGCLEYYLSKSDSRRRDADKLFCVLNETEQRLVIDGIINQMLKEENIDENVFKSFVSAISYESILPDSINYLKKIPSSRLQAGFVGQLTSLKTKLSTGQNQEFEAYLNTNPSLGGASNLITIFTKK